MEEKGKKILLTLTTLLLLAAVGLAAASAFYPGWIKYTVKPAETSKTFNDRKISKYIYNTRRRGLFFFVIDDAKADIVKNRENNSYFHIEYNTPGGAADSDGSFWSLTKLMNASVGLHLAYLIILAVTTWMLVFSWCCGERLAQLAAAVLILGMIAGGVAQAIFHIYIDMEKHVNILSLTNLYSNWDKELKDATSETYDICFYMNLASFAIALVALLLNIILICTGLGEAKRVNKNVSTADRIEITNLDNLAYDADTMVDKPARAELWQGFDRFSEKLQPTGDQRMRATYSYDNMIYGDTDTMATPTRKHYHQDTENFPIRY